MGFIRKILDKLRSFVSRVWHAIVKVVVAIAYAVAALLAVYLIGAAISFFGGWAYPGNPVTAFIWFIVAIAVIACGYLLNRDAAAEGLALGQESMKFAFQAAANAAESVGEAIGNVAGGLLSGVASGVASGGGGGLLLLLAGGALLASSSKSSSGSVAGAPPVTNVNIAPVGTDGGLYA